MAPTMHTIPKLNPKPKPKPKLIIDPLKATRSAMYHNRRRRIKKMANFPPEVKKELIYYYHPEEEEEELHVNVKKPLSNTRMARLMKRLAFMRKKKQDEEKQEKIELLPHDVIIEILSWLSPDNLLKFSSVCKSWYSTIRDVNFTTQHHKSHFCSNNIGRLVIVNLEHDSLKFSLVDDAYPDKFVYQNIIDLTNFHTILDSKFDLTASFDYPARIKTQYQIKSSCNGLFCWANPYIDNLPVLLCNPNIRLATFIPPFSFDFNENIREEYSEYYYGVGYDKVALDYKVVKFIVPCFPIRGIRSKYSFESVAIYSLKTKSWKKVNTRVPVPYVPDHSTASFFLHGCIHWIAYKKPVIIIFDVCNEVFRVMQTPKTVFYGASSIHKVNDSICFTKIESVATKKTICHAWMMKEYGVTESWVKHLSIEMHENSWDVCIKPTIEGKFIFNSTENNQLTSYDPETGKCTNVVQCYSTGPSFVLQNICPMTATLELLI